MSTHPLTRPASWTLTVGAPDMPFVRWAGAALWASGGIMGGVWLVGLTDDVLEGYAPTAYLLVAWPAVLAWLVFAWRIWRRWSGETMPLTLEWAGPVATDRPERGDRGHREGCRLAGGFHVREWHGPVRVRLVMSWQGWLLLSLVRASDVEGEAPTYAWLDARGCDTPESTSRNRSLHQLRTLLHLPPAMTTQEGDPGRSAGRVPSRRHEPVASWGHSPKPGSSLQRLFRTLRVQRSAGPAAPGRVDTAFPATTVMAEHRRAGSTARARGEGR